MEILKEYVIPWASFIAVALVMRWLFSKTGGG